MSTPCIIGFGEAITDFIWIDGNLLPQPGGAIANVTAAASKLGSESYFVGSIGNDCFGDKILEELSHLGVNINYAVKLSGFPTGAAYVSIDQEGERSFTFYNNDTAELHFPFDRLPLKILKSRQGIFHFGSNSLTTDYLCAMTLAMVTIAKSHKWTITFDTNIRDQLWPDNQVNINRIRSFMSLADYIKISDDELSKLSQNKDVAPLVDDNNSIVVITSGSGPVNLYTQRGSIEYTPKSVEAVDTTGAGDAFWGAFISHISNTPPFDKNDANSYKHAVKFAADCGSYSVQHLGAIKSYPHLSNIENQQEKLQQTS